MSEITKIDLRHLEQDLKREIKDASFFTPFILGLLISNFVLILCLLISLGSYIKENNQSKATVTCSKEE